MSKSHYLCWIAQLTLRFIRNYRMHFQAAGALFVVNLNPKYTSIVEGYRPSFCSRLAYEGLVNEDTCVSVSESLDCYAWVAIAICKCKRS